jgi:ABC-type multidrug transport system ATPase subunit
MTNSIVAEGLTKRFGTVTAVDGINLAVQEGAVFGLLGPNGWGKTTTVTAATGKSCYVDKPSGPTASSAPDRGSACR